MALSNQVINLKFNLLPPPVVTKAALVYCEGNFAELDGKTAHGLVRFCEAFKIKAVIDSQLAGNDAGLLLDGISNGIPIVADLATALALEGPPATTFIYGMAPATGLYGDADRRALLAAMAAGLDLVSGMREFLNEDPEFAAAAAQHNVSIRDVRRPPDLKDLHLFNGSIATASCVRIAVLGTDGAIGKRTTATLLVQALNESGIHAVLVCTGQTGLIQGGRYGIPLDAIPSQFCSGEVEAAVVGAYRSEKPAVIVIEGQGALSHPAYLSSSFILRGSQPQAVVLQHAPARRQLSDFPFIPMPTPASEIKLIESFAPTRVIGLTLNHEGMDDAEVSAAIALYSAELAIPVTDAVSRAPAALVAMVLRAFPELCTPANPKP
ncbi:DUF1611 domain-containing protein [Synechococcus sp. UW140]|uniref:DUF1611 domain-containing protein n=1 Tax=Synechococcus sp. UW140 TaxID=368503 RepID=UPI00313796AE